MGGDSVSKFKPKANIIGITLGGSLEGEEINTIRVERQVLHKAANHHIPGIPKRNQAARLGAESRDMHQKVLETSRSWLETRGFPQELAYCYLTLRIIMKPPNQAGR
jgi:hypothetical protein